MEFKNYLSQQLHLHPIMQPQDVLKLCFQAAFGAEHLLADTNAARTYFYREYETVSPCDGDLYENISDDVCRISLSAWKASGMPAEWLFRMFVHSASVSSDSASSDSRELFDSYLEAASRLLQDITGSADPSSSAANRPMPAFSFQDWQDYLSAYLEKGITSVHHSQTYRDSEHPAYRIVKREFTRILPILAKATQPTSVIAIDGRAASGKTTLAGLLSIVLDADIIHMDDFFLPPALRSKARLAEPGGNVHYERFIKEVLPYVSRGDAFAYTIFDCGKMDYDGQQKIKASKWRIVEGSYSHHPAFGDYADMKIYSHVDPEEQMRRILIRNGEFLAEKFRTLWIPMEETYFSHYRICENADLVV